MTRFGARIAAALALLLVSGLAVAAVLVPLSLEQMAQDADAIVLGEAVSAKSFWGPQHKRIYTDVTLRVAQVLKGTSNVTEVTVRRLGGVVDDVGMKVPGNGTITIGERHLLFLRNHTEPRHFAVMGLAQGIYRIQPPERAGEPEMATRNLAGAALARPLPELPAPDRLPLPELLTRINQLLAPAGSR